MIVQNNVLKGEVMDKLIITKISNNSNDLSIKYSCEGLWSKYLSQEEFLISYSVPISKVPNSILIIPLITTLLPIAWINNLEIVCDSIDKDFFDSIQKFKAGYEDMYPNMNFLGNLNVKNIVSQENKSVDYPLKEAVMFSGGVDAYNTLFSYLKKKPYLISIWGADVGYSNNSGWENVENQLNSTAEMFNLEKIVIRSNFREIVNESKLNKLVSHSGDKWWHGFQHGIGLLGHVSPLSYTHNISQLYIASSFTFEQINKWGITCASDPRIDNNIKFNGCNIIHDGEYETRQDKIRQIGEFVEESNISIKLRACYIATDGNNCSKCEKCSRTILGLLAEKKDPSNFGFNYNKDKMKSISKNMKRKVMADKMRNRRFLPIQARFIENYSEDEYPHELLWFINYNLKKDKHTIYELFYYYLTIVKKITPHRLYRKLKTVI